MTFTPIQYVNSVFVDSIFGSKILGHFKNFLYDGDKLVGQPTTRVIKGEITELHSTETTEETTEVGLSDEIGEIVGDAVQPEKMDMLRNLQKGQIVLGHPLR